jgi:hypothetical protein
MDFFDNSFYRRPHDVRAKSLQWLFSDNIAAWEKYQPNPYSKDSIGYDLNEFGFRSDAFITCEHRMVFIGCSYTKGIGLPLEETFSHIIYTEIKKNINIDFPYWNIGVGSAGLDTISRIFFHFRKILRPQVVVALFPDYRLEFIKNNAWEAVLPTNTDSNSIFETNTFLINPEVMRYNTQKNLSFIDLLLSENNSQLFWDTWALKNYDINSLSKLENFQNSIDSWNTLKRINIKSPKARDGVHAGKKQHEQFAQVILNRFGDQICKKLLSDT